MLKRAATPRENYQTHPARSLLYIYILYPKFKINPLPKNSK